MIPSMRIEIATPLSKAGGLKPQNSKSARPDNAQLKVDQTLIVDTATAVDYLALTWQVMHLLLFGAFASGLAFITAL